jgi:MFS family permease
MRRRIFYGWWIVLATNLICLLGYGTWLYTFGVFFKPMASEFGWTRAMTAGAYSLRSIEGGIASPIVGWAVDKYGARVVILIGGVISGLGFVLMPLVNSLLDFYIIYGIVLSIGMSAMLYLPAWTVIARWFRRRLSRAQAVLSVGAAVGGAVCAPVSAVLIGNYGWRTAFVILGVTIWIVVLPLALVVRNSPEEMGLQPDGDPPVPTGPNPGRALAAGTAEPADNDYTLGQALRSPTFWLLGLAFFLQGFSHSTVTVHTVPALTDVGIPVERAAQSFGLLIFISVIGRLSFGFLGDYVTKRYLFMVSYTMMGAGLLVLMTAQDMFTVYLFIALFGIGFGGNVPLMPAIRAEYFGRAALGKIQGFMNPLMMFAGFFGPILAGYLFDVTGTYRLAFGLTALLTFVAAFVIFFARPAEPAGGSGPGRTILAAGSRGKREEVTEHGESSRGRGRREPRGPLRGTRAERLLRLGRGRGP